MEATKVLAPVLVLAPDNCWPLVVVTYEAPAQGGGGRRVGPNQNQSPRALPSPRPTVRVCQEPPPRSPSRPATGGVRVPPDE